MMTANAIARRNSPDKGGPHLDSAVQLVGRDLSVEPTLASLTSAIAITMRTLSCSPKSSSP
ncbi:MAG: hypothetical protein AAF773_24190, partial [Cyanobacteria bacterium P01_D01_bin.115]